MNTNRTCVLQADKTTRELKRGSADYWIIYVYTGEAEFITGANVCCAIPNQAVIITMGNRDIQINPSNDFTARMVCINDSFSSELIRRYLPLMNIPNETMNMITAGKQQKYLPTVLKNLQNTDAEDEEKLSRLLEELIIRLYRASPKIQVGTYANRAELVSNVRQRLEREYSKDFTLATIAEEYDISVSYLAHLFKSTTRIPIMQYLLNCRIFAAQEYLTQTFLSINEVAVKCGFHDSSNFGRTFKKETGYSPRQYRRRYSSMKIPLNESFDPKS